MTADLPSEARWRNEAHSQNRHYDTMQALQAPVPAGVNPASQMSVRAIESTQGSWNGQSHPAADHYQMRGLPSLVDAYTDGSTYRSRSHERHSPPPSSSCWTNSPPRQTFMGPWQSLAFDHHARQRHISDGPQPLHISKTQELPKISTSFSASSAIVPESQALHGSQSARLPQTTSLPSFATIQEHAGRAEDPDEVEIAPMSARLSCSLCDRLKPMIRDVAVAVAEIDGSVPSSSHNSATRTFDIPKDNSVRTVQWILNRLAKDKRDLQETAHRTPSTHYHAQPTLAFPGIHPGRLSPPNPLKRLANQWDQDDFQAHKQPRTGTSPDEMYRTTTGSTNMGDRRASIDFAAASPVGTESFPGSAYPRSGSPGLSSRPHRTLPSPSSMAFPLSAAPSLVPPTAQSAGSPVTSYQPSVSIHTASSSSATSAHIADLQHQVTLKSLALQTLQSEYSSLLQKLQRERVKSQTIEKKTTVADQEVNNLTGKTEDLTEQVKMLETQLEESERKREVERADSAREKAQWLQMLDMGSQMTNQKAELNLKLKDDIRRLNQRLAVYEEENSNVSARPSKDFERRDETTYRDTEGLDKRNSVDSASPSGVRFSGTSSKRLGNGSNEVENLKREVSALSSRIDVLRFCLEETRRRNQVLHEQAREVLQRKDEISSAIDRALQDDIIAAETKKMGAIEYRKARTTHSSPARQKPRWSPPETNAHSSRALIDSPAWQTHSNFEQSSSLSMLSETMANIARAVSPDPAELGIHVIPSTSSPEELIRALGPVPAPTPVGRIDTSSHSDSSYGSKRNRHSASRKKPRKPSPWVVQGPMDQSEDRNSIQSGSFRPLVHHVPSPYGPFERVTHHADTSPHSYHNSPGPTVDDSSNSGGSASGPSPKSDSPNLREDKGSVSTLTAGQVPLVTSRSPETSSFVKGVTVMPPPPRPALGSTDLHSIPGNRSFNQWSIDRE